MEQKKNDLRCSYKERVPTCPWSLRTFLAGNLETGATFTQAFHYIFGKK